MAENTEIDLKAAKAAKADYYFQYVAEQGYRPKIDADGDVEFMKEGFTCYISVPTDDDAFFRVLLPNFWPLPTPEDLVKALHAANYANRFSKVVKLTVSKPKKNVNASFEAFLGSKDDFKPIFERALRSLTYGLTAFRDYMQGRAPATEV